MSGLQIAGVTPAAQAAAAAEAAVSQAQLCIAPRQKYKSAAAAGPTADDNCYFGVSRNNYTDWRTGGMVIS